MSMREVSIAQKSSDTMHRNHLTTEPSGVSGFFRIPPGAVWDAERARNLPPDVAIELMPGMIGELATRLGRHAVLPLVEAYGGTTLSVPLGHNINGEARFRELAQVMGEEAARRLCHDYGGTSLYIPTCARVLQRVRNAFLQRDRDRMASEGLREREIISVLARRYHTSDRTVWRILKQPSVMG